MVDDEPFLRDAVAASLRFLGFEVTTALRTYLLKQTAVTLKSALNSTRPQLDELLPKSRRPGYEMQVRRSADSSDAGDDQLELAQAEDHA